MRKQLIAACVLGLLSVCVVSAQKKSDREVAGLSGPVKSVRTESAKLTTNNNKSVESARTLQRLAVYDEQGNMIELTRFDLNGTVLFKTVYNQDAQGNSVSALHDGEGKLLSRTLQFLNEKGKPNGFITFDADGKLQDRSVETRGTNGRVTEGAVYNANGSLLTRSVFSYDSQGKQIDSAIYDSAGRLMQKTVWAEGGGYHAVRYDERGNIWFEGTKKASTFEDIDPHGNWTEQHTAQRNTQGGQTEESVSIIYRTIEYHPLKKQ